MRRKLVLLSAVTAVAVIGSAIAPVSASGGGTALSALWVGNGLTADRSGFSTTVCNEANDPYVEFVLSGTAATTASITVGAASAQPMTKVVVGRNQSTWKYTFVAGAAINPAALLTAGVTVAYNGKAKGTLTAGRGCTGGTSAVVAGEEHTCALLANNTVKCWGANDDGQLGLGDNNTRGDNGGEMGDSLLAVDLGTGRTAKAVTAGGYHTCALLDNNTVKCWGGNFSGQLGLGDNNGDRGDSPGEMGDHLLAVSL
jgi:hypothetical protein